MNKKEFKAEEYLDEPDEFSLIYSSIDPMEIFILGFIKGFNRRVMKAWQQKNLANYS